MQSAAEACFKAIVDHFSGSLAGKKAQILCGPGNNGGDGAALAPLLAQREMAVDVILFGRVENTKGDARTNFEQVCALVTNPAAGLSFRECETSADWQALRSNTYDVIVDALFGIGLSRPLEGIFAEVVEDLARRRQTGNTGSERPLIVAVDLPSGLNADDANPIGKTIEADLTITFTAPKPANVLPPASHLNGRLIVADIGSPASLIEGAKPKCIRHRRK